VARCLDGLTALFFHIKRNRFTPSGVKFLTYVGEENHAKAVAIKLSVSIAHVGLRAHHTRDVDCARPAFKFHRLPEAVFPNDAPRPAVGEDYFDKFVCVAHTASAGRVAQFVQPVDLRI